MCLNVYVCEKFGTKLFKGGGGGGGGGECKTRENFKFKIFKKKRGGKTVIWIKFRIFLDLG